MIASVNSFLQILVITVGTFMIERYVLLEPAMEPKKQRIFYIISFVLVITSFFVIGENAQYIALVLGGLNIFLGRKKHRFAGFLLVVPLIGIMNGVAVPVLLVPFLTSGNENDISAQVGVLAVYLITAGLLALFYFKGKNWRKWFSENMKDRRPSVIEYVLIIISGLLITIAQEAASLAIAAIVIEPDAKSFLNMIMVMFFITTFVLTVTLIVMIMQGNRRKFYHDKVSAMQFSIIATMADIVENRDENTGGHIKRTAKYVEIIGKKLRADGKFTDTLTEPYLSDMIVAAPLHDIGKIHIPDSILNKPARLTAEEFEIMKTHTTAGRDVLLKAKSQLGGFDYLDVALEMAEYHHEWWNGKGYPNGLKGDEIPLCARIMAVADVFDALTAKRCYKEAMPPDKAFAIIKEETGDHFDTVIAQAFLDCRGEVEWFLADNAE